MNLDLLWTFLVGVGASLLSGLAGGGGGLISAPFFIPTGLPPHVAVATTKFGALGVTLGSLAKFRQTEHVRREHVVFLSILSIAAAIIGTRLLILSSDALIEKVVGVMMLASLPFIFLKNIGVARSQPKPWQEMLGYIFYFIILVLQAAFGAGIGMVLMIIMMGLMGFTALEANATRRIPGFLLASVSLLIFILSDVVYYSYGVAILAGMLIGGYLGAHIAIRQGNSFVKAIFAMTVAILGAQLLLKAA